MLKEFSERLIAEEHFDSKNIKRVLDNIIKRSGYIFITQFSVVVYVFNVQVKTNLASVYLQYITMVRLMCLVLSLCGWYNINDTGEFIVR